MNGWEKISKGGHKKEVNLPEIQAGRDRRRRSLSRIFLVFSAGLLVIGFLWVVIRSPIGKIKKLEIVGNDRISQSDIEGLLRVAIFDHSQFKYLLGFRNLLIWPDRIDSEYLRLEPYLKDLTISKKFWQGTIKISVEERMPYGIWCFSKSDPTQCVWFDSDGAALERTLSVDGNLIVKVSDFTQDKIGLGALVLANPFFNNLMSVIKVVRAANLSAEDIRLEDLSLQEVKIVTRDAPDLYYSLRFPAGQTLAVIQSLRKTVPNSKKQFANLEYVDFRSENRAYFK